MWDIKSIISQLRFLMVLMFVVGFLLGIIFMTIILNLNK